MATRDRIGSVSSPCYGHTRSCRAHIPSLDIESRSGALYCQICDDIIWDPTLEELRVRKIGTGSFSGTSARSNWLPGRSSC